MGQPILIVQRFYYNFREGFFEYLVDQKINFKLINSTSAKGKVRVHSDAKNNKFILKTIYFFWSNCYVIFPFLFFRLITINPRIIISEGGQNTINNMQIYLYSLIFRKKYIIWDLGKGYADFGSSFLRRLYMSIYVKILKKAVYVYGYNSQSKVYFQSLGVNNDKIIVLNNTIDTRKIKAICSSDKYVLPEELKEKIAEHPTFLIFVGTLIKSKNIEDLSKLLVLLGKDYCLIIVGDGTQSYVEQLKESFSGTNHVFVGYKRTDQLLPYYRLSSFSVLPGLGGLSINQAMAFGIPVICKSADGAEKDLVIDDETGYIFSNLNDASDYIKSKNNSDWILMGKKAEEFLYSNHSIESMMDKFIYFSFNA